MTLNKCNLLELNGKYYLQDSQISQEKIEISLSEALLFNIDRKLYWLGEKLEKNNSQNSSIKETLDRIKGNTSH